MQLKDKVAVVLGASEAGGTGWAIAQHLAGEGAKVVVAARRAEPLQQLARSINGLAVVCDGAERDQVAALSRTAADTYGGIDFAVNCAFVQKSGLIADVEEKDLQRSLDVNFIGQVHFVKHMAEIMNAGGAIILFSSAAASQPQFGNFSYACAKAATDCLVRYAATEYGSRGIRVNSILAGPIRTGANAAVVDRPDVSGPFVREIPLGRVGVPTDMAEAVVNLLKIGFITGANLEVDGGIHLNRLPPLASMAGRLAELAN